jgi:hypothetical protein
MDEQMTEQTMEQGPAPSIEERVGKAFSNFMGFDKPQEKKAPPPAESEQPTETAEAAPEETESPPAEEFFDFEMDGQKYQLPKQLEKAVMQERDYTQKSQENAKLRKTFEALHQQQTVQNMQREFDASVAKEIQQLQAFESVLSQTGQINWAQMTTDEAMRQKIQLDQWKEQRDQVARELQVKYQQFGEKRAKAIEELKAKAIEVASQRIPNWSDQTQKSVKEHALSEGYTDSELSQAGLDPRHWVTLWKAQQFDLLKSKAAKTVNDVKSVKTTSSNPMPQQVKDKLAFNKAYKAAANPIEQKQIVEKRIGAIFAKR